MLKGRGKLLRLIHEDPALADWWIAQERSVAGRTGPDGRACESMKRFRFGETYAELKVAALSQCAPKARITSGGRYHPESCRLIW